MEGRAMSSAIKERLKNPKLEIPRKLGCSKKLKD
jgi:hypothetical protein